MTNCSIRVAKVGGSLLDLDDLSARIMRWLDTQEPAKTVLIAGGGPLVEMVRYWSRNRNWPDEQAHWLAIQVMGINARRVSRLAENWQLALSLQEVISSEKKLVVLDVESTLRSLDATDDDPLPCNWEVTSDSIAARVARELESCELILFKSVYREATELGSLAAQGIVDSYFPQAADRVPVRIVNLR